MAIETNDRFNLESLRNDLGKIFNESQHIKNSKRNLKEFMKIYQKWFLNIDDGEQFKNFMQTFIDLMKNILACDSQSPYTKRVLDFLALIFKEIIQFEEEYETKRLEHLAARESRGDITMADSDDNDNDDDCDDDEIGEQCFDQEQTIIDTRYISPPCTVDLFIRNYLLKFIKADDIFVRRNSVSLLKKTLESLEEVDELTFNEVLKELRQRSIDKDKFVRALIMLCLRKFQNITIDTDDDEAIKILKFHLQYDPDSFVRSCAMKVIGLYPNTLDAIKESTININASIRRLAFLKIAEHSCANNFPPNDRLKLLKDGYTDPSTAVQNVLIRKLLPNWISDVDNDLVRFFEYFNIRNEQDFFNQLFDDYFQSLLKIIEKDDITAFHQLVFNFRQKYLGDMNKLPSMALPKEEFVYLWNRLCRFCKSNNVIYKKPLPANDAEDGDAISTPTDNQSQEQQRRQNFIINDLLDDIFPDIPVYCDYVESFVTNAVTVLNENNEESNNNTAVGRKKSNKTDNRHKELNFIFEQLLNIGCLYKISDQAQWNYIERTFRSIILNDQLYQHFNNYIEPIFEIFNNYFQNNSKKLLDLALDLINTINLPELHCDRIQTQTMKIDQQQQQPDEQTLIPSSQINPQERIETDPKILERCINICNSFLHVGGPKNTDTLSNLGGLINKLVLRNLANPDSNNIRLLSVKALGNYCFQSLAIINSFLKVFVEIIEEENYCDARIESLKYLFDFVGFFGMTKINFNDLDNSLSSIRNLSNSFNNQNQNNNNSNISSTTTSSSQNRIFYEYFSDMITNFLQEPSMEPLQMKKQFKTRIEYDLFDTTVRGLCKILYIGRLSSSDFLARLIIIFITYKNITAELKHFIRVFIHQYSENLSAYFELFKTKNSPFNDAYVECFRILLENDNNHLQSYEMITCIIDSCTNDDQRNNLIMKSMEIFTLTSEKEFIHINLKLIDRIIDYKNLEKSDLLDLIKQFEQYRQRYYNRNKMTRQIKQDKSIILFDKIIRNLRLTSQGNNQSIIENDNENNPRSMRSSLSMNRSITTTTPTTSSEKRKSSDEAIVTSTTQDIIGVDDDDDDDEDEPIISDLEDDDDDDD
uniref:Uncharacterized protein LOC113797508 n=1 Tax=Dermatophagoides pteronyssinus TaxID=6956 RepID=A0A6P6YFP5_DERPT|nr:uncharacterized protein LOC113797508 [Dermatophagoides pteronyssinus]